MAQVTARLVDFAVDERGATAIEYGLIAAMIAVACVMAITAFGTSLLGLFTHVDDRAGEVMSNAGV